MRVLVRSGRKRLIASGVAVVTHLSKLLLETIASLVDEKSRLRTQLQWKLHIAVPQPPMQLGFDQPCDSLRQHGVPSRNDGLVESSENLERVLAWLCP